MNSDLEPFCFFCGGNARYEFQTASRPFYPDAHVMCDTCAAVRGDGIMVFELVEEDPGCGNPTLPGHPVYYTGRWTVIDNHKAAKVFAPDKLLGVVSTRIACLRADNYAKAGLAKYPWRTIQ